MSNCISKKIIKYDDFIKIMSNSSEPVFLLEEDSLTPIEILIFVNNRKILPIEFFVDNIVYVEKGDKIKQLKIIEFKIIGLKNFYKQFMSNSISICGNLVSFGCDDLCFIVCNYFFLLSVRQSYVTYIGTVFCKNYLQTDNIEELRRWYLNKLSLFGEKLTPQSTVKFDNDIKLYIANTSKLKANFLRVKKKIIYKLVYKFRYFVNRYILFNTSNRFIGKIRKAYKDIYDIEPMRNTDSKSAIEFLVSKEKQGIFFYKGGEAYFTHSVDDEIKIQQFLLEKNDKNPLFLSMLGNSTKESWIKYPFIAGKTLHQRMEEGALTENELYELGKFLVNVVDSLWNLKVYYRDLRSSNIMQLVDDKTKYILIDFGAATLDKIQTVGKGLILQNNTKSICGNNRYNEDIIDDAASAYLIYIGAGGNVEDEYAHQLLNRVGRFYFTYIYLT